MVTRLLGAAAAALLLAGCDQFTKIQGAPVPPFEKPIVVMHRGAGANNPDLRENTMPAIVFGAGLYDGAEMDLQLSSDGTIWLGHDNKVHDCSVPAGGSFVDPTSGGSPGCFQELSDAEIDGVAYCDTATAAPCAAGSTPTCLQRYVRLEEVFQRFSTDPALLEKVLALDVKDQLCSSSGFSEARTMANALHGLVLRYQMDFRLIVESDQKSFMRRFHDNRTPTFLYVEGYGQTDPIIEDAARERATGISYRYYNEAFDPSFPAGLRNVGLRTMVFAVPDPVGKVEDIAPVWAMKPDVIATDRPDFMSYAEPPLAAARQAP
jgi:glycerophosphoryl diester phosphodiesterase